MLQLEEYFYCFSSMVNHGIEILKHFTYLSSCWQKHVIQSMYDVTLFLVDEETIKKNWMTLSNSCKQQWKIMNSDCWFCVVFTIPLCIFSYFVFRHNLKIWLAKFYFTKGKFIVIRILTRWHHVFLNCVGMYKKLIHLQTSKNKTLFLEWD